MAPNTQRLIDAFYSRNMIEAIFEPFIQLIGLLLQAVAWIVITIVQLLLRLFVELFDWALRYVTQTSGNDVPIEKDSPDVDFPRGPSFPPPSEDESSV